MYHHKRNQEKNDFYSIFYKFRIIYIFILSIFCVGIITAKAGLLFETNDDIFISHLLSGSLISKQQIRMYDYVLVLETIPFVTLYRFFPSVPWYGLFIVVCHLLMIIFPLDVFLSKAKKYYDVFVITAFTCTSFLTGLYIHSRLQFTSTAEVLAIVGFICFVFYDNRKKAFVTFVLFETLSITVRCKAMLLMLPMGAVLLLFYIVKNNEEMKERLIEVVKAIILVALISLAGIVTTALINIPQKYRTSYLANKANDEMVDYFNIPEYDSVQGLLTENGITESKYRAFFNYLIIDWEKDYDALINLHEYNNSIQKEKPSIFAIIKNIFDSYFKSDYWYIQLVIAFSWIIAMSMMIINSKSFYCLFAIIYSLSKIISMGYLFYNGRVVGRVLLPLIYVDILIAMALILSDFLLESDDKKKDKLKKIFTTVFLCAFVAVSFFSVRKQYRYLFSQKDTIDCLNEYKKFINEYCDNRSDNSYILSSEIYIYWPSKIYETTKQEHNYTFSGGWYSLLPESQEYVREYIESANDLYYICLIPEDYPNNVDNLNYLKELFGYVPQLEEELELPTGSKAGVYRIKAKVSNSGTKSIN